MSDESNDYDDQESRISMSCYEYCRTIVGSIGCLKLSFLSQEFLLIRKLSC